MVFATPHRIFVPAVATLALCLASCTTLVEPQLPPAAPFPAEPPVADSSVTVPIDVAPSIVASVIDQNLGSSPDHPIYRVSGYSIYDRNNVTVTAQMSVYRTRPTDVTWDGNNLKIRVQVAVGSNPRVDVKAGSTQTHVAMSGGPFDLTLTGTVRVNPDWTLNARVNAGATWDTPPSIAVPLPVVGSLRVNVGELVSLALQDELPSINDQIEAEIRTVPLPQYVGLAWKAIQRPIAVSVQPPVTLLILPSSASVVAVTSDAQKNIVVAPTLVGKVLVTASAPPASPQSAETPLPPNSEMQAPDAVHAQVRIEAPYQELDAVASGYLVGKTFSDPTDAKRQITVDAVSIGGLGGNVMYVKLGFHATVSVFRYLKGWLYFIGTPVYDDSTRHVRIENVKVDLATNNLLLNALANWILQLPLDSYLDSHLDFDLSSKVGAVHKVFDRGLSEYPVGTAQGYRITLDLQPSGQISISSFFETKDAIGLFATVNGTMALHIAS